MCLAICQYSIIKACMQWSVFCGCNRPLSIPECAGVQLFFDSRMEGGGGLSCLQVPAAEAGGCSRIGRWMEGEEGRAGEPLQLIFCSSGSSTTVHINGSHMLRIYWSTSSNDIEMNKFKSFPCMEYICYQKGWRTANVLVANVPVLGQCTTHTFIAETSFPPGNEQHFQGF